MLGYIPKKYNYIIPPPYLTEHNLAESFHVERKEYLQEIKNFAELYSTSVINEEVYLFLSKGVINKYLENILREIGQDLSMKIQYTLTEYPREIIHG